MNRWTTRARKGAHAADTLQGPTVLTATGAVGKPNRPAFDPFTDAFLKVRGVSFTGAHAFDRASLAALPQASITARIESWPAAVSARGPRLADVMAAAGVSEEAAISLVALDGYEIALSPEQRRAQDWVLAIEANGAPLALGGRGPAWLVHDTAGRTLPANAQTNWVWSVFLITATLEK